MDCKTVGVVYGLWCKKCDKVVDVLCREDNAIAIASEALLEPFSLNLNTLPSF